MPTTQDGRSLQLSTPLGKDYLLINGFTCNEGLNQLFHIKLDLLHEEAFEGFEPTQIDAKALLGNPMALVAVQADEKERYFNGMCISFTQTSRNQRFSEYRAELVPNVWLLTQITQSRIFQEISVPDILAKVLKDFEFTSELQGTYEPRNYCVQYRESDWDFVSRLMEEEGIYYYFEHTPDNHKLIIADTPASHRDCPEQAKITYALERSESKEDWVPAVYTWQMDDRFFTGKVELRDFNFQLPTKKLESTQQSIYTVGPNNKLEMYDWPGEYAKRYDGIDRSGGENSSKLNKVFSDRERVTKLRQREIDVDYNIYVGSGNCAGLTAGHKFVLTDHPIAKYNGAYVLTTVQHGSLQSPGYISEELDQIGYQSTFTCIKHGSGGPPYCPPRRTPKPYVRGSQTAFVVGPAGEEIFTDKYGRVKVQFHWDREGQADAGSSCWLRVAQSWAGNLWGTMFIPRIGMEVLVDFLEGDPDQPIITGCVYNAANMPPYVLPENKTRSVVKTNSSKGGGGFNEVRIEDKKEAEQIFVHAEKNMDIRVKNDCMETIMHDRHLIVQSEQFEEVRKDKHLKVLHNHNEDIGATMSLKIGQNHQENVGTAYNLEAGTSVHIKAGNSAVIEAGTSLTLKAAGNFINIGPSGVFIKGTMVMINSGGAAGSGPGASPEAPKAPKEADKGDAGRWGEKTRPLPPPAPPKFSVMAASIQAVRLEDNVPAPPRGAPPSAAERSESLAAHGTNEAAAARAEAQAAPSPYVQPQGLAANYVDPPIGEEAASPPEAAPPGLPSHYSDPNVGEDPAEGVSPQGSSYLQGAAYETPLIG